MLNKTTVMDIEILISKKGTKVVTASNLHLVLGIPNHHYSPNLKKWLDEVYQFRDGIRKPVPMEDFAKRKINEASLEDYYLSIELAKLITLRSKSKHKLRIANSLLKLEDKVEHSDLLSPEQVLAVLDLTKVMGLVSCQLASEQQHHKIYESRNNGTPANWWNFRENVLGYSTEQLRKSMQKLGRKVKGKSQRQLLMQLDKYEMVRVAVIDLFMAMGKTEQFARNVGELAKAFAQELKVEIFDDRNASLPLLPNVNLELVNEVLNMSKDGGLQRWESLKMAS